MSYEAVIGLEVHVQLKTETKIFCRCPNRFGADPNTLVCPVCLGYPGTLPVLNRKAVDLAALLALALGAHVHPRSVFARKNYFYADLPKGYQISQYDRPLAEGGRLPLATHDREIRIERLHLEEDAGKLLHEAPGGRALPGKSLVDFNRCGVPLVEIVSAPEVRTPEEAQDYLQSLRQVLLYTGASDANMEEGSLRCDANVSVRKEGDERLGTKTEVKNLNSFRFVARALEHEIERQVDRLEGGERIVQETRSFDAASGTTCLLRTKEEAHDYRYFPEPDLPHLIVDESRLEALRELLPELPWQARRRLEEEYGLPAQDAGVLTGSRDLLAYFEAAAGEHADNPKAIANWVMTEVLRELKERKQAVGDALSPRRLAELVQLVDGGRISNSAAKTVLAEIWGGDEEAAAAVERLGLAQVRDEGQVERWVEGVLEEHAGPVEEYLAGKTKTFGFLVGQVMRRSQGRAEPKLVQKVLRRALERRAEQVT